MGRGGGVEVGEALVAAVDGGEAVAGLNVVRGIDEEETVVVVDEEADRRVCCGLRGKSLARERVEIMAALWLALEGCKRAACSGWP